MKDTEIMNIRGIDCYEKDGTVYLRLENVARGLGFTEVAKSGNECVKWSRVKKYLGDLKFIDTCVDGSKLPDFIPENIFYRLAMKAKNETAERFQALVADEIIPSIRKHGIYATDNDYADENSGIYQIKCLKTGKIYIGQSKNLKKRKCVHFRMLKNNKHWNSEMQKDYNKYGETSFNFSIIKICEKELLDSLERKNISKYNIETLYNKENGGNLGKKISEDTKIKISNSMKGIKKSESAVLNMSIAQKKRSKEISEFMRGHSYTKGIKRSEEFKSKISKSLIGNKRAVGSRGKIKPVIQYTKNGELLKKWEAFVDIENEFGYSHSNIIKCCKGEIKSAYGYIWKYA